MGIKSSTIKSLYAKSGNKCAYPGCTKTLIEDTNNSNICHIISEKPNGPRHDPNYRDYDNEENLILLCRNHHNEVDTDIKKYSVNTLYSMKERHERLIKDLVDNNREFYQLKGILLKGIDYYDIIDIIEKEDYSAPFPAYKLDNISNFIQCIDSKILTTYNSNFINGEFISNIKNLSSNLHKLETYLFNNTIVYGDGRAIKVMEGKVLDLEYINKLRISIADEIKKYI